jgi:hypothetical protein
MQQHRYKGSALSKINIMSSREGKDDSDGINVRRKARNTGRHLKINNFKKNKCKDSTHVSVTNPTQNSPANAATVPAITAARAASVCAIKR